MLQQTEVGKSLWLANENAMKFSYLFFVGSLDRKLTVFFFAWKWRNIGSTFTVIERLSEINQWLLFLVRQRWCQCRWLRESLWWNIWKYEWHGCWSQEFLRWVFATMGKQITFLSIHAVLRPMNDEWIPIRVCILIIKQMRGTWIFFGWFFVACWKLSFN